MTATAEQASLAGVTHHYAMVNGTELHYVAAGTEGPPVLLVHGFPETWWPFRNLIPLLAASHRVYAVDLRGFGDSDNGSGAYDSKTSAEDLHLLIEELNVGRSAVNRVQSVAHELVIEGESYRERQKTSSPTSEEEARGRRKPTA